MVLFFETLQTAAAQQSLCARVKIEIRQELALERQAFEATMTINNGLTDRSLTDVSVDVLFETIAGVPVAKTTNSNDVTGKFFVNLTSGGPLPGTVAASSSTTLKWLIVPTQSAGGDKPEGRPYHVGATLKYKVDGKEEVINVQPDLITVMPTGNLVLDYFLTRDVVSDDPFTPEVEPAEAFALALRVKNTGFGAVRNFRIDSGQPKITDNAQGLLIDFKLIGADVNEAPAQPSLLANLGDLLPKQRTTARWWMTCSLPGYFSDFQASFSHASEFGGQATSLIEPGNVKLHSLCREVIVDLPGRDSRKDFLGDDMGSRVFETDDVPDSDVNVIVEDAYLQTGLWRMAGPPSPNLDFVHIRVPDQMAGTKELGAIVRADGKRLLPANAWLSKARDGAAWKYFVDVFDTNNPGGLNYTISYGGNVVVNHPPVWGAISDQIIGIGQTLTLNVRASDSDGTVPALSTGPLPTGAQFSPTGNGRGVLTWTPATGQDGRFAMNFRASDGSQTTSKTMVVTVTDGNRLESWKNQHWPGEFDPSIVGNGADPDRDGLDNLLEYALNLDPTKPDVVPIEAGSVQINGKTYLTLTCLKRTDDPTLQLTMIAADNPTAVTWSNGLFLPENEVDQTGVPAGMIRMTARDTVAMEDANRRRVMRVKVQAP